MTEIRVDLIIEPGTPSKFLNSSESDAIILSIRKHLSFMADEIGSGYVEVKQRKDGNYGFTCHAPTMEIIRKMDKVIADAAGK